jgi:hypothetical protein
MVANHRIEPPDPCQIGRLGSLSGFRMVGKIAGAMTDRVFCAKGWPDQKSGLRAMDFAIKGPHFSAKDVRAFYRMAAPNLQSGCWGSVRRRCTRMRDCLDILPPNGDDPILAFERDHLGVYHLWSQAPMQERRRLQSGDARQCLETMMNMVQAHTGEGSVKRREQVLLSILHLSAPHKSQ